MPDSDLLEKIVGDTFEGILQDLSSKDLMVLNSVLQKKFMNTYLMDQADNTAKVVVGTLMDTCKNHIKTHFE